MLKVSTFVLAVFATATAFLTPSAFSNQNSTTVSKNFKVNQSDLVYFHRVGQTFTSTGEITLSGSWIMVPTFTGPLAFHCVNTLTSGASVLVATSNCNWATGNGVWHIVSATGEFEELKRNGKLSMPPTEAGQPTEEIWVGTIK